LQYNEIKHKTYINLILLIKLMKLSIVIPSIDEDRLKITLFDYLNYFNKKYHDFEIIIIRNLKSKPYSENFLNLIRKNKKITTYNFNKKTGKGDAVIQGFKKAKGNIIGFIDEDDAIEPQEFDKLIKLISKYDCVIASRRMPDSKILINLPISRKISSILFNFLVNILFKLNIRDTQCGAKVFKKNIIKKVIPKMTSTGFEFDVELLWRIKQIGQIKEKGIKWTHQQGTSFSLLNGPLMIYKLLKLKFYS